jgi:DNA-binding transcriptional ArsR family regulator
MARLLPSSPDIDPNEEPRVVGLDSDDADELIDALSSTTTRRVLAALHEEPAAPSELADRVDTSLQNVQYHLGKLADAGLVEVGDTVYSEKGREMDVYVPADRALVVVAGREEETTGLKAAVSRLLGGIGVLGLASVVVDRLARGSIGLPLGATGSAGGEDVGSTGDVAADGGTEAGGSGGAAESGATETPEALGGAVENRTATTVTEAPTETETEGGVSIAEATATRTEAPAATPQATGMPTETAAPEATMTTAPEPMTEPAATTGTPLPTGVPTEAVETAAQVQPSLLDGLAASPGLFFFLGGSTILVGGFALWWLRR